MHPFYRFIKLRASIVQVHGAAMIRLYHTVFSKFAKQRTSD